MSCKKCEVLEELLKLDAPCPEIMLEEGDICLDWRILNVTIMDSGKIAWAFLDGEHKEHGVDLKRVKELISAIKL